MRKKSQLHNLFESIIQGVANFFDSRAELKTFWALRVIHYKQTTLLDSYILTSNLTAKGTKLLSGPEKKPRWAVLCPHVY